MPPFCGTKPKRVAYGSDTMITGSSQWRIAYVRDAAEGCRSGWEPPVWESVVQAMTRKDRHPGAAAAGRKRAATRDPAALAAERREAEEIRAFLTGRSNGGSLLHALYDHILDEKVPSRLRAPFKTQASG
jgi:hypothetical protein